ncbi:MAG: FlgD immunoglobulin-like domain containing protein [Bacteroidota bacterium]
MRRIVFFLFLIALLFGESTSDYLYQIFTPSAPSSIVGLEDLNGRLAYEQMLTANPETGQVPDNIRLKELSFSNALANATKGLRKQDLDIQSIGPSNVGGRTRAIALDVRNENVILAGGVSGGIWKSIDGGVTWIRKSDPENRNSVTCIVQDTREGREDTWYHGTGELVGNSARGGGGGSPFRGDGIYKSVDNGETWEVLTSTSNATPSVFNNQFQYIWDMEVNDRNLIQDELIVAAFGGILKSVDGGDSWSVALGQELFNLPLDTNLNGINASFFSSLEKTVDGTFYASLSTFTASDGTSPEGGIYVSQNTEDWFNIDPFSRGSVYQRVVMGHAPSDPRQCYFLVDSNPTFLLRYTLNGFGASGPIGNWSEALEIPAFGGQLGDFDSQGSYNMLVKVDPSNANTVFVGGTNLYRSTDGFQTAENIDWIGGYDPEGGTGVYLNHHPDQHNLIFFPSDPNKLLSTNDGGVRLTNDFNADSVFWEPRNEGYLTSQFFTVALSQESDGVILGGMQDNGTDFSFGEKSWDALIGGDGGYAETTRNKTFWYTSFQNGQTLILTLNEASDITSFARVDPAGLVINAGGVYLFVNPFVVDPTLPTRMFIAGGNFLYVNDNVTQIPAGTQDASSLGWNRLDSTSISDASISSVEISTDGTVLYFGASNGQVFKLVNADRTLDIEVTEITSSLFSEGFVSSIAIDPENADHLMVVFSNYEVPSIFESNDGGVTFQNISGNLEEFEDGSGNGPSVRWGEIIPTNGGHLFLVGTSVGLYSTETTSTNTVWLKESVDLIGSSVIPMIDYRPLDGKLAIATHGNGVFSATVSDFKPLTISSDEDDFQVVATYPNPFADATTIQFGIPEDGIVKVDLFSAKGDLVKNLLWAPQFSGTSSVTWDGTNAVGTPVENGIYFYRITYNGKIRSGRLSLRR